MYLHWGAAWNWQLITARLRLKSWFGVNLLEKLTENVLNLIFFKEQVSQTHTVEINKKINIFLFIIMILWRYNSNNPDLSYCFSWIG